MAEETRTLTRLGSQIARVVQQLQSRPYFLYLYLDALFSGKDPHLASDFADMQVRVGRLACFACFFSDKLCNCAQVKLYAEFATHKLIDFLRASSYYNLEAVCPHCYLLRPITGRIERMFLHIGVQYLHRERLGARNGVPPWQDGQ